MAAWLAKTRVRKVHHEGWSEPSRSGGIWPRELETEIMSRLVIALFLYKGCI